MSSEQLKILNFYYDKDNNDDNIKKTTIDPYIEIDDEEEFKVDDDDSTEFIKIYNIFYNCFHTEISNIIENKERFGINLIRSSTINSYIKEIRKTFTDNNDVILNDLIVLYYITKSFYKYNKDYLNFSYREFREKIYYPNIIYLSIKFLFNSHRFLNLLVHKVFIDYKYKYPFLVSKFLSSYYYDEDLIKSNIFYKLLGSQIPKFNPLSIEKHSIFFKEVVRNIFYYFFKSRDDLNTSYGKSMFGNDDNGLVSHYNPIMTGRINIYKDILYNIFIEKTCNKSLIHNQISYNFNIFQKIIIPNEIQEIFYTSILENNNSDNEKFKILNIYDENNSNILLEIKKLPIIYRLLKSVHILNPKVFPHNSFVINKDTVKNEIYSELFTIFRNLFCDEHIKFLLNNIANNFVNNILSGEYINLLTLNTIRIDQISFVSQLKQFVKLCIKGEF